MTSKTSWYQAQTLASQSLLRRLSHSSRYRMAADLAAVRAGETVLDYGAGDGTLLVELFRREPAAQYWAMEPSPKMRDLLQAQLLEAQLTAQVASSPAELPPNSLDLIVCTEVLEHLPEEPLDAALRTIAAALKRDGRALISVPIETGLPSLLKNLVRRLQGTEAVTLRDAWNCALGQAQRVNRGGNEWYIPSHLGFDFRSIEQRLPAAGLKLMQRHYSPLPLGAAALNSQIFWSVEKL